MHSENDYILGLDVGDDRTAMAFFNLAEGRAEVIDPSGGYGRPAVPTAAQFLPETGEWVYGEVAMQSPGQAARALVSQLGTCEFVQAGTKTVRLVAVLGGFLAHLLAHVKSINPRGRVVGLLVAVPDGFPAAAEAALCQAVAAAGYEDVFLGVRPQCECLLAQHYAGREGPVDEHGLWLDYGAQAVRCGLFRAQNEGGTLHVTALSYAKEPAAGTHALEAAAHTLFARCLAEHHLPETAALSAFTYQQKDALFQKKVGPRPLNVYFNFAFPPFRQAFLAEDVARLVAPAQNAFVKAVADAIARAGVAPDTVLCAGGGFEMPWPQAELVTRFPGKVRPIQYPKGAAALGAAWVAAQQLGVAGGLCINVAEALRLPVGIALEAPPGSIPLAAAGTFWWESHAPVLFMLHAPVADGDVPALSLVACMPDGETIPLKQVVLPGLPARPKGTTRLCAQVAFSSEKAATLTVTDEGFGGLFPKTACVWQAAFFLQ